MAVRRPLPRSLLRQELARLREALDAADVDEALRLAGDVVRSPAAAPAPSRPGADRRLRPRRRTHRRDRRSPAASPAARRPHRRTHVRSWLRPPPTPRHGRPALTSLLLAKLSLVGLLATFLSLFVEMPRGALARRLIFVALVVFTALLFGFSLGRLRSTGGTAGRLPHHLTLLGVAGARRRGVPGGGRLARLPLPRLGHAGRGRAGAAARRAAARHEDQRPARAAVPRAARGRDRRDRRARPPARCPRAGAPTRCASPSRSWSR